MPAAADEPEVGKPEVLHRAGGGADIGVAPGLHQHDGDRRTFHAVSIDAEKTLVNEWRKAYITGRMSKGGDMAESSAERRKFARLDLALTVSYRVAGRSADLPLDPREAISSDVSLGGLRLMTPSPLANGTLLDLEIILGEEEGDPIRAEGEVVWQNKISGTSYETGVQIRGMPAADKKRFMEFVFDQMSKVVASPL